MGHRETLTPNLVTIAFIIAKITGLEQTDKAFNADQDKKPFRNPIPNRAHSIQLFYGND